VLAEAAKLPTAYVFPSRLEEMQVLEAAIAANPKDSCAPLYLGNFLYDRQRYGEAMKQWERAVTLDAGLAVAWRNLGIGYYNVKRDSAAALAAFDHAFAADPGNPRLLYERDQLWKRTGVSPAARLDELLRYAGPATRRDDLSVELATLFNLTGQPQRALDLILSRNFQPWEGGEGLVLAQFVRASILLAQNELAEGRPQRARDLLAGTLSAPWSLGESWHLLANQSEPLYWLGLATAADGEIEEARRLWLRGARMASDFQQMAVAEISANTFWVASCLEALSRHDANPRSGQQRAAEAAALFEKTGAFGLALEQQRPVVDYFATSLPTMLLFHEDLTMRNRIQSLFLRAQSALGLGHAGQADSLAHQALALDPSHAGARDLLRLILRVGSNDLSGQKEGMQR
jgi:tetratricopeptide (TPR) repeat protein